MINIFGVIGQDVKASEVMQEIQAYEGDKIEVIINSVGGSVYEGMAIYGALKNDPRPIKTTVLGIGASIASVIFMAGDEREIGEGSQLMIHNSLAPNAGGNKYEMKEAIERLEQIDSDMKKIYSSGTGLQDQILESMLEKETFLNADEALKLGFATGKGDVLELVAIYNKNKYKEVKKRWAFYRLSLQNSALVQKLNLTNPKQWKKKRKKHKLKNPLKLPKQWKNLMKKQWKTTTKKQWMTRKKK
jgi:ATP-dependent protease ClpP protease subunit